MKFEYNKKICYNYKDPVGKTTKSRNSGGGLDMMERYKIFYKGIILGELLRKTEESKTKHQFLPSQDVPQEIKEKIKLFPELLEVSNGWQDPIPVLENRIRDAKRFDADAKIVNQTDGFEIEKE